MAASWSGILTLLALLLAGPLFHVGRHYYYKKKGLPQPESDKVMTGIHERDTMDSQHYIFSLIGYAIGIGNIWR